MPDPSLSSNTDSGGLRRWVRSLAVMISWELRGLRMVLPIAIVVQVMIGAGMIIGFGFLLGDAPAIQILYLCTGVTVISMITLGLVLTPQLIAEQKARGVYDYIWSLPVPRSAQIGATLFSHSLIVFPGVILALLVAVWRYHVTLHVTPIVVPATVLTLITAASIGLALGHTIPNPMVTGMITQVLVFVILLFSPINFPADRLPGWLAALHSVLPFEHAANVMRAGLADGLASHVGRSLGILGAWAAVSALATAWAVGRRR